uniref:Large ribosomal subunit protein mL49 n=1 Tax=Panagrolaimus sp. ES5 TaxID=591445 RepID=A0AC34FTI8_9BILA
MLSTRNFGRRFSALIIKPSCSRLYSTEKPWEDPWKHALPQQEQTLTDFKESSINWSYVERLLPKETIPPMPLNCGILPSGWRPPKNPPPALSYFIGRDRKHQPALFLERRRDQLNTDTMDFEYVELVTMAEISGDVYECEKDVKEFLENELGHPIATYVDEIKGKIKVKGAQRSLLEKFIFEKGF